MDRQELLEFCDQWLESWTGNEPERLLAWFSADAEYLDPGVPAGLRGQEQLRDHFTKLLAYNPKWVWTREELAVTERGFTLKWKAQIPVGDQLIEEFGLDIVEVEDGKITRNEVYFDRVALLGAIAKARG